MKVAEQRSGEEQVIAFVITGDGRTEQKVLSAIAEKYNGKHKLLLFPKSSLSKKTGLGTLKSVNVVHKLTEHSRFLILIDKEHFDRHKLKRVLSETFKTYTLTGENPYVITSGDIEIYLVILGERIAVEEHIAALIELEFGVNLRGDMDDIKELKSKIMTFIRTMGIKNYRNLIRNANIENVEKSFQPLVEVLKLLEKS